MILTVCRGGRETAGAGPRGCVGSVAIGIEAIDNSENGGVGGALGGSFGTVDSLGASENASLANLRLVQDRKRAEKDRIVEPVSPFGEQNPGRRESWRGATGLSGGRNCQAE